jgi:hypothetical protein
MPPKGNPWGRSQRRQGQKATKSLADATYSANSSAKSSPKFIQGDELTELVERELDSDRRFFAEHPHRRYRIRWSFPYELLDAKRYGFPQSELRPGYERFTVVKQLVPGIRFRLGIVALSTLDLSMNDAAIEQLLGENRDLFPKVAST